MTPLSAIATTSATRVVLTGGSIGMSHEHGQTPVEGIRLHEEFL
jgi:hypothetical protein